MPRKKRHSNVSAVEQEVPVDRKRLVMVIILIHGMGLLLPWHMFITADDYFIFYKLNENYTGVDTPYNKYFLNYVGFAAQIPSVIFNWINIFIQFRCNLSTRIFGSLIIQMTMFVLTIILAMIDSSGWPGVFFTLTIIILVIMMTANAIYTNSTYGVISKLPPKFIGNVVLGNNITGVFVTIISILSDCLLPNKRTAAIYYFIVAFYHLGICFDTFFALPINKYYRYYELKFIRAIRKDRTFSESKKKTPYWYIFKKAFPQLLNVFMILFISLSVFPAIYVFIQPCDPNFFIPPKLYISITCFLTFNVFSALGSFTATFFKWPKPKFVCLPVFARIVFFGLFIFCNYRPLKVKRTLSVLIYNDWVYWFIGALFGYTNGYFTSVCMMYIPGTVEDIYANVAGMFGSAILVTGAFAGILLSFIGPVLVSIK